jgi:peroxiredoxin
MAQLRRDYEKFKERGVEVIIIGPEEEEVFRYHWKKGEYPFVGIADPDHKIADLYNQQVKILKMGRMPAQVIIDRDGFIRSQHHGVSMRDILENTTVLNLFDKINSENEIINY